MPDATNLRLPSKPVQRLVHAVRLGATRLGLASLLLRRRSHPLEAALQLARAQSWETSARWLLSPAGRRVLGDTRLATLLAVNVVRNVEVELLLTEVRRQLLLDSHELLADGNIRAFVHALIRQCDLNEYVFYISDEEHKRLADVESEWNAGSMAHAADAMMVLAMYVPVRELLGRMPPGPATRDTSGRRLRPFRARGARQRSRRARDLRLDRAAR